jgi:arylsulfatase
MPRRRPAFAPNPLPILSLVAGFASVIGADPAPELRGRRPNIILIMPDDMGWGDLGVHGHPLVKTPNLDRLHADSFRFTDFHVSPTCAPTRSALLSGRHEFKNGVTHTIDERERLNPATITLPDTLRRAGYATGIFGKWHLGDEDAYQPNRRGFEEVFIHGAGGIGQSYPGSCGDAPGNTYHDPWVRHNGRFVRTKGFCTDVFFNRALEWIGEHGADSKPFFAMITPNAPHDPLISPGPKYDAMYAGRSIVGKPIGPGPVAYYGMISNIDDNVGRLLARLDERKLAENTLVIFFSDNGGTHTRLFSGGFRAGKGTPYHGGTHIPSFWRLPGAIKAGVDCPVMTAHIDLFPTLLDVIGVKPEEPLAKQIEGRSLLPLLVDPTSAWSDRTLVTHVGRWKRGEREAAKFRQCSIRNQRFRLVNNRELYDLASDPGESKNVIAEHPEVTTRLRSAYDAWWDQVQPMLVNETAIGPKINPFREAFERQMERH